jgi:hypothetical protein
VKTTRHPLQPALLHPEGSGVGVWYACSLLCAPLVTCVHGWAAAACMLACLLPPSEAGQACCVCEQDCNVFGEGLLGRDGFWRVTIAWGGPSHVRVVVDGSVGESAEGREGGGEQVV